MKLFYYCNSNGFYYWNSNAECPCVIFLIRTKLKKLPMGSYGVANGRGMVGEEMLKKSRDSNPQLPAP